MASKCNLKCLCDLTCSQAHQKSAGEKIMKTILAIFESWLLRCTDSANPEQGGHTK